MSKTLITDVHIRVFKKAIKTNGKMELLLSTYLVLLSDIISLNGVKTLFKAIQILHLKIWNKILQVWFKIVKNDEEVYIQQKIGERVEVYYEHLLKLVNYLKIKTTYVFFTIIFRRTLHISDNMYEKKYLD
jgi:hypothetical protein